MSDPVESFTWVTWKEVIVIAIILFILGSMLAPVMCPSNKSQRRTICAGNLKQIGLAQLTYAGDNGGYFPILNTPRSTNFEPLNTGKLLADGKVYSCPSAQVALSFCAFSNYRYRGSGLRDDNDSGTAITLAYDVSGNHPDNQWASALFIDGHAEGARPDGGKGWNLVD